MGEPTRVLKMPFAKVTNGKILMDYIDCIDYDPR